MATEKKKESVPKTASKNQTTGKTEDPPNPKAPVTTADLGAEEAPSKAAPDDSEGKNEDPPNPKAPLTTEDLSNASDPNADETFAEKVEKQAVAKDVKPQNPDGPIDVEPLLPSVPEGPVISKGKGSFTLEVASGEDGEKRDKATKVRLDQLSSVWAVGEGFPAPGEVIIDLMKKDGQSHQRYSTWTDDGSFEVALPGSFGPGDWLIHAESPVTQVGEGRKDNRQEIRVGKELKLEVTG